MGDTRHTIDLFWSPQDPGRRRGRRPGLSVRRVIETGIALADAEGLEGVSMRRVAQRLGVVPMTLYTYVPDKATLLELMLDRLHLAMERVEWHELPWRERLAVVAEENRRLYARHPWAAELPSGRPPRGPGRTARYEHELTAFAGCGLDDVETDAALTFLLGFVQSCARAAAGAAPGAAGDPGHAYAFGLQRVLDGLGVLITARTASDPRR